MTKPNSAAPNPYAGLSDEEFEAKLTAEDPRYPARKAASEALQAFISDWIKSYELDDGEVNHSPTEFESFLIYDAIAGLTSEDEYMRLWNAWRALCGPQAGGDATPVAWIRPGEDTLVQPETYARLSAEARKAFRPLVYGDVTRPTPAAAAGVPTPRLTDEEVVSLIDSNGIGPVDPEVAFAIAEAVQHAMLAASPVAPAGVPTDELMREAFADEVWRLMRKNAMRDDLIKPMNIHTVRALVHAMWEARAVLSAGAPAVPMQDEKDSSSVHFAAPGSTVPTALTVGTPQVDRPPFYMVFDVESVGLHGEGFAVGWVVVDHAGAEHAHGLLCCDPLYAEGLPNNLAWVQQNVPSMEPTAMSPYGVREDFWAQWLAWNAKGAVLVADCAWPVEARFLAECVDDARITREWEGPYPLHDLASVLLALGRGPLATNERLPDELPAHHPLNDARQSARLLIDALRPIQSHGRDGVTGSAASSEAAKPLASNGTDGHGKDCA